MLQFKFNWDYYGAKSELPYKEYPKLLNMFTKIIDGKFLERADRTSALFIDVMGDSLKDLKTKLKKNYFFSILTDHSTDSANFGRRGNVHTRARIKPYMNLNK